MKRSFAVMLSVFIMLSALGLAACQVSTAAGSGKAPDFTLNDVNGKPFKLSDTAGKVVLLDFFATWCPPCRMEVPHLQELHSKYKDRGLVVVGISLDQGGANDVKPFIKQYGITYPVVMGNQGTTDLYGGIRGIPTMFIVDKNGNITQKLVGYREKKEIESEIQKLL